MVDKGSDRGDKTKVLGVSLKGATRIKNLDELYVVRRSPYRGMELPENRHHCIACLRGFDTPENLQIHLALHTMMIACRCSPCKTWHIFLNPCKLKAHLLARNNAKPTLDNYVAEVFRLPLRPLLTSTHNLRLLNQTKGASVVKKCPVCATFVASTATHLQTKETGGGGWCPLCVKMFPTTCMMILHHKAYHASSKGGTVVCPECGKPLPDRVYLAHAAEDCMHLYRSQLFRCRQDPPSFLPCCGESRMSTAKELAEHYAVQHSTCLVKRGRCPTTFLNITSAKHHVETAAHPPPLISYVLKCPLCDKTEEDTETLIGHIMQKHKEKLVNDSEPIFACPYNCDVKGGFGTAWKLRMHIFYDHGAEIRLVEEEGSAAVTTAEKKRRSSSEEDESEKKKQRLAAHALLILAGEKSGREAADNGRG